jgi:rubrerythrin
MAEIGPGWHLVDAYKKKFHSKPEHRLLGHIEHALVAELSHKNSKRDTEHIHPSSMCKSDWCIRETYYTMQGTEESNKETLSLRRMNIFAEGHNIHDKWQRWMWKAGGLVGVFKCTKCEHLWHSKSPEECPECGAPQKMLEYREVPIYNDLYHVIGHADGIWEDKEGRAVVELKSVGLGTIRWDAPALYEKYEDGEITLDELWKRIKRPLTVHRRQVSLYMYFLGISQAIVIYEWKPTQEVKEFHLKLDMDVVQPMLDKAKDLLSHVEDGTVPPRPDNARKSGLCKYCPYKSHCWEAP